jgi:hypothetical protein
MDANTVRNMYIIIAVTNKHTAKLHHVGSLYILTYDEKKKKKKEYILLNTCRYEAKTHELNKITLQNISNFGHTKRFHMHLSTFFSFGCTKTPASEVSILLFSLSLC